MIRIYNYLKLVSLLILINIISGCNEASTPQQALDHVINAINTSSSGELDDYLLFDAKRDFNNVRLLRAYAKGRGQMYGIVESVKSTKTRGNELMNWYRATIYAGVDPLFSAEVLCDSQPINDDEPAYFSASAVRVTFCFLDKLGLQI